MNPATSNIAPAILVISLYLSVVWGVYVIFTLLDYRRALIHGLGDRTGYLRRFIVAVCLWSVCFSYVFRTTMVLLGFAEAVAGQVTFYALLGTNVLGSLYALVTVLLEWRDRIDSRINADLQHDDDYQQRDDRERKKDG